MSLTSVTLTQPTTMTTTEGGWANPVQTGYQTNLTVRDARDYQLDPPPTTAYPGAYGGASINRCSPDSHRFACRHENVCECGRTQRLMDHGLTEGL